MLTPIPRVSGLFLEDRTEEAVTQTTDSGATSTAPWPAMGVSKD